MKRYYFMKLFSNSIILITSLCIAQSTSAMEECPKRKRDPFPSSNQIKTITKKRRTQNNKDDIEQSRRNLRKSLEEYNDSLTKYFDAENNLRETKKELKEAKRPYSSEMLRILIGEDVTSSKKQLKNDEYAINTHQKKLSDRKHGRIKRLRFRELNGRSLRSL